MFSERFLCSGEPKGIITSFCSPDLLKKSFLAYYFLICLFMSSFFHKWILSILVWVFLISGIVYAANTITSLSWGATNGISQWDMIAPSWYQEVNNTALMAKNTIPVITGSLQTLSGNLSTLSGSVSTLSGRLSNTNFSQWSNYPNNTTPTGIYYPIGNVGIWAMPTDMTTKLTIAWNTDIQWSIKLWNNSNLCTSTLEWSIRYNTTTKVFEWCDGASWKWLKDIWCTLINGTCVSNYSSDIAYQSGSMFTYSGMTISVSSIPWVGKVNWQSAPTGVDWSLCQREDIVIFSWSDIQVWSACNVGTDISGTWYINYSYYHYQWWRNDPIKHSCTNTAWACSVIMWVFTWVLNNFLSTGTWIFYAGWTGSNYDWYRNEAWLWTNVTRWAVNNQWPCPNWYKIPSANDFNKAINITGRSLSNIVNRLYFPRQWRSYYTTWNWDNQSAWWYWSSTPSFYGAGALQILWDATNSVSFSTGEPLASWFPIRCIKN